MSTEKKLKTSETEKSTLENCGKMENEQKLTENWGYTFSMRKSSAISKYTHSTSSIVASSSSSRTSTTLSSIHDMYFLAIAMQQ
jgi:hypothetical protein